MPPRRKAMRATARTRAVVRKRPGPSSLERTFLFYLTRLAPTARPPATEYRFCPSRRWRFDMAWPESKLAVELEGGVFSRGRHVRPAGFEADAEKYNEAIQMGWRVLRLTSAMLKKDPGRWIKAVESLLA